MSSLLAKQFQLGSIDRSRPFLPEHLSPLAYAPIYPGLPTEVRLRYNQLFASSYHEHFIFLERMLADFALPTLIAKFGRADPLSEKLVVFIEEERRHTEWFHALHRASEPMLYLENYYHFLETPGWVKKVFDFCARRPHIFPFCLWLAMIIEERTIPASRDVLREAETLELHYVTIHRLHLADEAGHVSSDAEALRRLWPKLGPTARLFNRFGFVTLLKEFFRVPKRAGWRVILQLVAEFPELKPLVPRLRSELIELGRQPRYLASLYSRHREPRTFALADRFPDLRQLEESLLGWKGGAL